MYVMEKFEQVNTSILSVNVFFRHTELQFRLVIIQKGMSPPHSPQKQNKSEKTVRTSVQKSAPSIAQTPPHRHIKG